MKLGHLREKIVLILIPNRYPSVKLKFYRSYALCRQCTCQTTYRNFYKLHEISNQKPKIKITYVPNKKSSDNVCQRG